MTDRAHNWQLPFLPEKYTVLVEGRAIHFRLSSHIKVVADGTASDTRVEDECTYRCEQCGASMPHFLREATQVPLKEDILRAMELHAAEKHKL